MTLLVFLLQIVGKLTLSKIAVLDWISAKLRSDHFHSMNGINTPRYEDFLLLHVAHCNWTLIDQQNSEISSNIRKVILQRFANKPPILTRAWIKFYDIMGSFPLFGSTDDTVRTLFLCEGLNTILVYFYHNQLCFIYSTRSICKCHESLHKEQFF